MRDRFDELLPWYVNGSISAEDRAFVDRYLAEHPEAAAELDWHRSLVTRMQETAPAVPETLGLAKAMTLIRGDRPTIAERVSGFFSSVIGMRPAMALAGVAIFAVQGGVILNLMSSARDDASELRSLRATVTEDRPVLKLNFAPDAREAEIRHLLVSVQGRLAAGPGQLGDYYVIVPAGREAAVAEELKANKIVQAVSVEPGLPPRE
jgi:hypothetical protein